MTACLYISYQTCSSTVHLVLAKRQPSLLSQRNCSGNCDCMNSYCLGNDSFLQIHLVLGALGVYVVKRLNSAAAVTSGFSGETFWWTQRPNL